MYSCCTMDLTRDTKAGRTGYKSQPSASPELEDRKRLADQNSNLERAAQKDQDVTLNEGCKFIEAMEKGGYGTLASMTLYSGLDTT